MSSHRAAASVAKGQPFEIQSRPTPAPGPGELLVAVKSVALNPADNYMRDRGLFIPAYPTVIGFDISGLVLEIGADVPTDSDGSDSGLSFRPGVTRVAAYAAFFFRSWNPNYGAFQERCLVPWQHAVPLPSKDVSWNSAATLPVSVQVPLCAWDAFGIPRIESFADSGSKGRVLRGADSSEEVPKKDIRKGEALLIWGASSSVGTMGVQSARFLVKDENSTFAAVYATAGLANVQYVKSLGADRVFDYKDARVVDAIVSAARKDELVIRHCFLAVGQLALCQAVLQAFREQDDDGKTMSKIGSAPPVPPNADVVEGIEVIFLQPSTTEAERLEQFRYWMGTWLRMALMEGLVRPSPEPTIVGRGLQAVNTGLDMLIQGVSCTKLVVEVEK